MAASNRRSSSPYRAFHKPASVDGHIPGIAHFAGAGTHFSGGPNSTPRGRSLTPTRVRAMPTSTFKFKFASPPVPSARPNSYGFSSFSSSSSSSSLPGPLLSSPIINNAEKENVLVTVRFRPLSLREIHRGDEVAWYADGDTIVRSEYNPSTAYGFDRVFGPATTTRAVYDAAARLVVRGAMEGVNGTVFAYGVTSSGKTHTMHGDQKSAGIIPLAVKDVFNIIQETPGREYLLRVSYLEIYNEVINDLLDPAGQNLRIREDSQGTYVEGVKEEVVLSPAHALSLIAAGEELRHVGSNNFNLLSSRSHTIFSLTIESSSRAGDYYDDEVILSQLNLIDLAGSESSKTETTGLRRKEGSYINKSLLTLGTVIGKLSDGKASHVPYRDSKLTRLLQSSLNGLGRVSLICTLTPASSNIEETHNTLKFAHRAKHVALHAAPNRIMDEKSLIKKYQREISSLRQELDQLKRGMFDRLPSAGFGNVHEDLLTLRQQLEAGQVKLQSRLEEEEQAKAALLGRIQRLTKLILVSTKNSTLSQVCEVQGHRRRHSFGEDNNNGSFTSPLSLDMESSPLASSPVSASSDTPVTDLRARRRSLLQKTDDQTSVVESFNGSTQAGELFSVAIHGRRPPPTGETAADEMDLLREQVKMLVGEVAFCTSSLKRMSEQALSNPEDTHLQSQLERTKDDIQEKRRQIHVLEKRIVDAGQAALNKASPIEMSETISKLMGQLNQKDFELEIKSADNRILQEQLQAKMLEIKKLQDTVEIMQEKLLQESSSSPTVCGGLKYEGNEGNGSISDCHDPDRSSLSATSYSTLQNQIFVQAAEMEKLKQEKVQLKEENGGLRIQSQKLAEEASYAQELASAAAIELKNLADEVTKLSFQNTALTNDLIKAQETVLCQMPSKPPTGNGYHPLVDHQVFKVVDENGRMGVGNEIYDDIDSWNLDPEDVKRELHARKEREASLEACLADKEQVESDLRKKLEDAKQREAALENDLAGMWVLVAKMKNEKGTLLDTDGKESPPKELKDADGVYAKQKNSELIKVDADWEDPDEGQRAMEELQESLKEEKRRNVELETMVSKLKSEGLEGLHFSALEELQNLHMEALTKLCQAKAKNRQLDNEREQANLDQQHGEERNSHICKVCFEAPTAAVLLPCRHFCLCKPCAVACSECPLCRSGIADRIITFTS